MKSQLHSKNWRNVHSAVEIENKPSLESMFVHKLTIVEWDLGANSMGVLDSTSFLEKAKTKYYLITSRHMPKVQEV